MERFYIVSNTEKKKAFATAQYIKHYLKDRGKICEIYEGSDRDSFMYHYTDASKVPEGTECIIVLGGDGTLIQASRDLMDLEIPLAGINLGTLGYLAEVDANSFEPMLEQLIHDDYYIEERMMIYGEIIRGSKVLYRDVALNDIVLGRSGHLGVIQFELYVNRQHLNDYKADGVIIATPTGSTAYNLSAGGPILVPDASMFVLTPICSHSLNSRSIVLPSDAVIELVHRDAYARDSRCMLNFDADTYFNIFDNDRIRILCSDKKIKFIRTSKISFLEVLRKKMAAQ